MTRTANLLYIGAFAGSLLALAIASTRSFGDFSVAADTPVLNGKLSHAFEKHYDAQFPVKQFGTNVWAALDYALFGEGRPGVVIGQDGWLYSDEEFKPVADGKQHLRDNLAIIRGVRDELARQDIQLVLADTAGRLHDPHDRACHDRLARPRLAHHAQHLAARHVQIDAVDCLDQPVVGLEVGFQIPDLDQVGGTVHGAGRVRGRTPAG